MKPSSGTTWRVHRACGPRTSTWPGPWARASAESIKAYETTLALKSDHANAHEGLGVVLARTDRPAEAVPHYREAIRLKPKDSVTRSNLAAALVQSGNARKPREVLAEALRLFPEDERSRALGEDVIKRPRQDPMTGSFPSPRVSKRASRRCLLLPRLRPTRRCSERSGFGTTGQSSRTPLGGLMASSRFGHALLPTPTRSTYWPLTYTVFWIINQVACMKPGGDPLCECGAACGKTPCSCGCYFDDS